MNDVKLGFNRDAYVDVGDGQTPYSVTITGFASYALGDHSGRIDNSYSFIDDATIYRGRHTVKFGIDVRAMQENKTHPLALQSLSYLSEKNFISNILDSYSYSAPGIETQARKMPILSYAMDEFKIKPNLTLNAGLRYEYFGVDRDAHDVGLVFDIFTCGLQYCPPGTSFYYPNKLDFSPRIGIAWAPQMFHGKTVIRTGYGMYYDDGQFGGLYAASTNIGMNFSLTQKNTPGLSYPMTPYLGAAAYNVSYSAKGPASQGHQCQRVEPFNPAGACPRNHPLGDLRRLKRNASLQKRTAAQPHRSGYGQASLCQPYKLDDRLDHG